MHVMVIIDRIKSAVRVQNLDEAVYVSLRVNDLEKSMNISVLLPNEEKKNLQTGFFSLG